MTGRSRVTGHYAGPVTRFLAFILDAIIVVAVFSLAVTGVGVAVSIGSSDRLTLAGGRGVLWIAAFAVWTLAYSMVSLAVAGRTPGKGIIGLRVVDRDGSPMAPRQALMRTLAFPLSFALFGLGFLGIVFGREHRALHDVLAATAVVYDWGDRPAELPTPLSRFLARRGAMAVPATEDTPKEVRG